MNKHWILLASNEQERHFKSDRKKNQTQLLLCMCGIKFTFSYTSASDMQIVINIDHPIATFIGLWLLVLMSTFYKDMSLEILD